MSLTEPIRSPIAVRRLLKSLQNHPRNYVLVSLCLHTALRISDILRLGTNDVYDFSTGKPCTEISLTENKTKKHKTIALHKNVISALKKYRSQAKPNAPLILNAHTGNAISRVQAYRIISLAAKDIGQRISCHSLRKTFGYHSWQNGVCPIIVMNIYNHSSMKITERYLGIQQDHLNTAYLALRI
ncbi:MAG: tyrosine-type recombinase/integrase [Defluviitaleaceae bacterium]|nr:tyrosine-type recombinase/integrase [Defluviitaleaceae bacterium]